MDKKNNYIELLRGLSVFAVFFFHYYPKHFPQGYLGVDIFFVISGYVIAKSLFRKEVNFPAVIQFYNKRIHRLLPALYAVLLVTIIASIFVDAPHATKNIGQGVVSTVLYLSNIFFYTEIDYFDQFQAHSPLLHTWSLSLEEQFYIFFPLILLFAKGRKLRILTLSLIFLISFLLYLIGKDPLYNHYMPHMRVWQILFGVLITFIPPPKESKILHYVSLGLLVFLLLGKYFWISNVLVVFLAGISILTKPEDDKYSKAIIVLTGALSYSFYLWHQPIIYFSSLYFEKSLLNFSLVIVVTAAASIVSFKYIEKPFRYKLTLRSCGIIGLLSGILLSGGGWAHKSRGFFELKKNIYSIKDNSINIEYDDLLGIRNVYREDVISLNAQDKSILIIGDSKAEDLLCSLHAANKIRYNYVSIPAKKYRERDFFESESIAKEISYAKKVIFTNTWRRNNLDEVYRIIKRLNKSYSGEIIVLSTSNFEDVSSQYFNFLKNDLSEEERISSLNRSIRKDWQRQSDELRDLLKTLPLVRWIDKKDAFLGEENGLCVNNNLMIYDTGHLTLDGFSYFGEWISAELEISDVKSGD